MLTCTIHAYGIFIFPNDKKFVLRPVMNDISLNKKQEPQISNKFQSIIQSVLLEFPVNTIIKCNMLFAMTQTHNFYSTFT